MYLISVSGVIVSGVIQSSEVIVSILSPMPLAEVCLSFVEGQPDVRTLTVWTIAVDDGGATWRLAATRDHRVSGSPQGRNSREEVQWPPAEACRNHRERQCRPVDLDTFEFVRMVRALDLSIKRSLHTVIQQ